MDSTPVRSGLRSLGSRVWSVAQVMLWPIPAALTSLWLLGPVAGGISYFVLVTATGVAAGLRLRARRMERYVRATTKALVQQKWDGWLPGDRHTPAPMEVSRWASQVVTPKGEALVAFANDAWALSRQHDDALPNEVFKTLVAGVWLAAQTRMTALRAGRGEDDAVNAGLGLGLEWPPDLPYNCPARLLEITQENVEADQSDIVVRLQLRPGGAVWRLTLRHAGRELFVTVAREEDATELEGARADGAPIDRPGTRLTRSHFILTWWWPAVNFVGGGVLLATMAGAFGPRLSLIGVSVAVSVFNLRIAVRRYVPSPVRRLRVRTRR